MAWIYLLIAGILEIGWALGLKVSAGFTRLVPSILTAIAIILSFAFLSRSLREIPLGTAYAVWTGIGAAGTAICGILFYAEPATPLRLLSIGLIVLGLIGLKSASS
jgi:quaternary ammonium compound-resistance protein SugE